jgi:hypothetical protein
MQSELTMAGRVESRVIRAARAPWSWRLRNTLRWTYLLGWLANWAARAFTRLTGIPTVTAELRARLIRAGGEVIDFGVISHRVVTTAGVGFLVDDWDDDTTDITNMNYHASGTDNTAENAADTALGAEATAVTDRATGSKDQPAANQLRSIGTQSFTGVAAIVEHGLFSVVTESAGVLWDRSVFSTINVGNGDSIQWTYTCTVSSGS